ncbi:MAG: methanethiol S-methyltransferase [Coleofasciculaceae cyanobacterium]
MKRIAFFVYGVFSYLIFALTIAYLIGFVGNFFVPKTLDSGRGDSLTQALLIDLGLILLFGIQHSVMARPGFKEWWTKMIPQPIERSTYVMMASFALLLLFWQWHPLGGIIWQIQNPTASSILYAISGIGWLIVFASTFLINHFDLFGLRQVYLYLRSQEYKYLEFKTVGLYKYVRHPLMLGFIIALWATPQMTVTHLLFAQGMTIYLLIGIQLEERDMISIYGDLYRHYRQQVSMLIPFPKIKETA